MLKKNVAEKNKGENKNIIVESKKKKKVVLIQISFYYNRNVKSEFEYFISLGRAAFSVQIQHFILSLRDFLFHLYFSKSEISGLLIYICTIHNNEQGTPSYSVFPENGYPSYNELSQKKQVSICTNRGIVPI